MERPLREGIPPDLRRVRVLIPQHDYDDLRITYTFLRWTMIGLPLLLLLVTGLYALHPQGIERSISAYYGGPIRDVFVGVIIATAASMVVYRGWFALEDFALNAAGYFAVFVALVPSGLDTIMLDLREREVALAAATSIDGDLPDEVLAALRAAEPAYTAHEYGWALRWALTAGIALSVLLLAKELRRSRRTSELFNRGGLGKPLIVGTGLAVGGFTLLTLWQLWWLGPASQVTLHGLSLGPFHADVHTIAAILMILLLVVVVGSHGWPETAVKGDQKRTVQKVDRELRHVYRLIAALMLVGPVGVVVLGGMFFDQHIVLALEWYEILLFCWFWGLETKRLSRCRRDVEFITT